MVQEHIAHTNDSVYPTKWCFCTIGAAIKGKSNCFPTTGNKVAMRTEKENENRKRKREKNYFAHWKKK